MQASYERLSALVDFSGKYVDVHLDIRPKVDSEHEGLESDHYRRKSWQLIGEFNA